MIKAKLFTAFFISLCLYGCNVGKEALKDKNAPDFSASSLADSSGKQVTLSEYYGKATVMLAFWATWCPPCVEEIPLLNEIYQEYQAKEDFKILAINVGEKKEQIESFIKEHPIKYEVLLDEDEKISSSYAIVGLPVIVIVAKTGEILYYGFSIPNLNHYIK